MMVEKESDFGVKGKISENCATELDNSRIEQMSKKISDEIEKKAKNKEQSSKI